MTSINSSGGKSERDNTGTGTNTNTFIHDLGGQQVYKKKKKEI